MNRTIENRLARLESATRARRKFILWDNSALDPQFDLEAEKDRLRHERGMRDDDELIIIVGWRLTEPAPLMDLERQY